MNELRARDGVFAQSFSHRIRQGLVDENYLELDLGAFGEPHNVMLYLSVWVYPTDTSINVALSQNPSIRSPKPPALWVMGKDGQWKEAIAFMGFPGGKTKTIAVDLSGIFESEHHRLRIVSSMELYWDWIGFTVDEPPADLKLQPLAVESAELRYRGFSAWTPGTHLAPEHYHYDQVSADPIWPPMAGRFTRYGDVAELVRDTDDLLVIMGAGDAMRVRFRAPDAGPPPGWKRDFLIHSVGWDKDADLNTVYGQTVEPLPFVQMSHYPYAPHERYPDSPRHQRYLLEYQTRYQDSGLFWRSVRSPRSTTP